MRDIFHIETDAMWWVLVRIEKNCDTVKYNLILKEEIVGIYASRYHRHQMMFQWWWWWWYFSRRSILNISNFRSAGEYLYSFLFRIFLFGSCHHPTSVSISLLHDAQIYHFKHTIILKFPCADIFFQFKCNFQVCVIFYLFIHFKNSSSALGHSAVECTVLEQLSFPLCIICDVMWWHSKWNKTWRHIGLNKLVYSVHSTREPNTHHYKIIFWKYAPTRWKCVSVCVCADAKFCGDLFFGFHIHHVTNSFHNTFFFSSSSYFFLHVVNF